MNERCVRLGAMALLAACGFGALGCDDPLIDPAVVSGPRVAAARVRAGDATAAAPPGELMPGQPTLAEPLPAERADDLLSLDGVPWTVSAVPIDPGAPCADGPLPRLALGITARVGFELGGDDREPLDSAPGTYAAHPRESLVYTHVLSHPGLE